MQTGETTSNDGIGDSATAEIKDNLVFASGLVGVITGILLCVIAVAVCLVTVVVNKRKTSIRSLQREILTR